MYLAIRTKLDTGTGIKLDALLSNLCILIIPAFKRVLHTSHLLESNQMFSKYRQRSLIFMTTKGLERI